MNLPYDPTITYLGIYPRAVKADIHAKTCTQMFMAPLFVTAKKQGNREQLKCPSIGEWLNKWWYHRTTECYSALTTNKLSMQDTTWIYLRELGRVKKSISKGHILHDSIYIRFYK